MRMMKKMMLSLAATGMMLGSMAIASPAEARRHSGYEQYRPGDYYQGRRDNRRYDNRRYDDRRYDNRRYDNRRYRCDNGTGGLLIGAVAGGLIGNEVAGYGDRTAGAVIGAVVGGLAGQAIDRSDNRRCR